MDETAQFTESAAQLGCSELRELVKTVELVHDKKLYRFEVFRSLHSKGFDVRVAKQGEDGWKELPFIMTDRDSIEGSLHHAISLRFDRSTQQ